MEKEQIRIELIENNASLPSREGILVRFKESIEARLEQNLASSYEDSEPGATPGDPLEQVVLREETGEVLSFAAPEPVAFVPEPMLDPAQADPEPQESQELFQEPESPLPAASLMDEVLAAENASESQVELVAGEPQEPELSAEFTGEYMEESVEFDPASADGESKKDEPRKKKGRRKKKKDKES